MLGMHGFSDRLERIFVGKALGKVFAKLSKDCNHERDHGNNLNSISNSILLGQRIGVGKNAAPFVCMTACGRNKVVTRLTAPTRNSVYRAVL